ncbi:MAG: methyltransferase MtaB domain-containing protein [Candidatus Marinimicrobia bacterium]|nr:methyltransferase MtaB domain-containing protein [Candidatus Neomarinimicrobiota bacterium]
MKSYNSLAIQNPEELMFGVSPHPVVCGNDLVIGDGQVFPEINFTLPTMIIDDSNWQTVLAHYTDICDKIFLRAQALKIPGLVMEFEQLPPMTMRPELGAEITALIKNKLDIFYRETSIPNALRVTVVDLRDADHPPLLRSGESWLNTRESFVLAAQAGADIISIESVGGKEVHDQALLFADLPGVVSSLGVLAYRDVAWLWDEITQICNTYNVVPGGDTACGFSNTAMQLAGQGMLPASLAALDRAASAPRSLAAFEHGAIGPSKDCAYEGPILKAIAGIPISMEGRSSCCAHFSPLGNIAGAMADLWSNESVQNIKLLSGTAPEAFLELLAYDCRLYNTALANDPLMYRNLLVESDLRTSPEAYILEPKTVIEIANEIVKHAGGFEQTKAAVHRAFKTISSAVESKKLVLSKQEMGWLSTVPYSLSLIPDNEETALEYLEENYGSFFNPKAYGI